MAQFTLHIDLGNDAMQTPKDVAVTLCLVADKVNRYGEGTTEQIMDRNGNRVGFWQWNEDSEEDN